MTPFHNSIKQRKFIATVDKPLYELTRTTKEAAIIGRYHFLASEEKCKSTRCKIIANELKLLWQKLNFPVINEKSISRKVEKLIKRYNKF